MRDFVERLDDPRLDDYRNLPDQTLLAERRIFIAEGRLVVTRLLASSRFAVRSLMLTRPAYDALDETLRLRPDVPVFEVSQETMAQVTGVHLHRGCLAVGERPEEIDPATLVEGARTLVALEAVGNADNVGGIFRNSAAFGADAVLLDHASTDPLYRKALRTSMGASLQVRFARTSAWLQTLTGYRRAGFRLMALTPGHDARPIAEAAADVNRSPVVVIVGHEGDGLSQETLEACDIRAHIPMQPGIDSLNVATAAAIALYEVGRGQRAVGRLSAFCLLPSAYCLLSTTVFANV